MTRTTCSVDIQTYRWQALIVPGFCTKLKVNGQINYVIDPIDLSGEINPSPVGAKGVESGACGQWDRDSPESPESVKAGSSTAGLQLAPGEPRVVQENHEMPLISACKLQSWVLL